MGWNPFRRDESRSATSWMNALMDGTALFKTRSGVVVNSDTALQSTAILACLIVRAETFASLPAHVFRATDDGRKRVPQHPVEVLIGGQANPLMTSGEFLRWKQIAVDVRGNAYVRVVWDGSTPVELWPLTSNDMKLSWDGKTATYEYAGDAVTPKQTFVNVGGKPELLHFKGALLADAWTGKSLVEQARESIGLTIATERFYSRLLGNGTHFPGYLSTDNDLRPEDVKALGEQFEEKSGIENAGRIKVFDRGLRWTPNNAMTIKDADLTSQQLFYLQQVCRIFRVPPPLVQDWSHSTYTNSEQADLWFAKHTVTPIAIDTERTLQALFAARGETDLYAKFSLDGLLRGDFKTRMEGYQSGIYAGFISRNEARKFEDWNPIPGLDNPLRPANTYVVAPDGSDMPLPEGATAPQRDISPLLEDARGRIRARAQQDAERGRDMDATIEFGRRVLAPFAQVIDGFDVDAEAAAIAQEAR